MDKRCRDRTRRYEAVETRRPGTLKMHALDVIQHENKMDPPSVMLFQARYNTPTAAVSNRVATKEPSTFDDEPCIGPIHLQPNYYR